MVFQRVNLIRHLTAVENVMLGLDGKQSNGKYQAMIALARVGMSTVARRIAWHLSAGELQRVAVARALVRNNPLTLADEPTANLDEENAVRVIDALLTDAQSVNGTLIVVSHDERIRGMFDRVYNIVDIS